MKVGRGTFPATTSINLATVIREGKPCGFMIISRDRSDKETLGHEERKWLARRNSLVVEGQVFLADNEAADALLPVTRRELVADLRSSSLACKHFDRSSSFSRGQENLVNISCRSAFIQERGGAPAKRRARVMYQTDRVEGIGGRLLIDKDIAVVDNAAGKSNPVRIQRMIDPVVSRRIDNTIVPERVTANQRRSSRLDQGKSSLTFRYHIAVPP